MTPTYEIQQLLYEVLDRLGRIERQLGVEQNDLPDLDGSVKFTIVPSDEKEKVIEFPKQD